MFAVTARIPTDNASKYVQQLCKHWSHRLDVTLEADVGTVRFPGAVATFCPDPTGLSVRLEADEDATVERLKGVISSHLDRFAFREAPLQLAWSAA